MKNRVTIVSGILAVLLLTGCAEKRETLEAEINKITVGGGLSPIPELTSSPVVSGTPAPTISPAPSISLDTTISPTQKAKAEVPVKPAVKKPIKSTPTPNKQEKEEIEKSAKPVKIINPKPGEKYPWFFVPSGQLAEAWGFTGSVLYANEVVSVISTGPNEAVVAVDSFSFRFATRYIGFDNFSFERVGMYTYISFFCGGDQTGGAIARAYNVSNTKPGALEVTYYKEVQTRNVGCTG